MIFHMSNFSEKLNTLLADLGWTAYRMADACNLNRQYAYKLTGGERIPEDETLEKIALIPEFKDKGISLEVLQEWRSADRAQEILKKYDKLSILNAWEDSFSLPEEVSEKEMEEISKYLINRASPLSGEDFSVLFRNSTYSKEYKNTQKQVKALRRQAQELKEDILHFQESQLGFLKKIIGIKNLSSKLQKENERIDKEIMNTISSTEQYIDEYQNFLTTTFGPETDAIKGLREELKQIEEKRSISIASQLPLHSSQDDMTK